MVVLYRPGDSRIYLQMLQTSVHQMQMSHLHLNAVFVWIAKPILFCLVNTFFVRLASRLGTSLFVLLAIIILESNLMFIFISYRNETHSKCPICQSNLGSVNDSWVLAELPQTNEVSEEIITELNALTTGSGSEGEVNQNQDARDDYDSDD